MKTIRFIVSRCRGICNARRSITTSSAPVTSLYDTHKTFLDLVKHQGSSGSITYSRIGSNVSQMLISNYDKKNAITGKMMHDLCGIVDDNIKNDDGSVLIITGVKDMFCSGADLDLIRTVLVDSEKAKLMSLFMTDALNRIRDANMISVCLMNGKAVGGGAEFSTVGDYRVLAVDDADDTFIQFIHAKLGSVTGWGGGCRLSSIVGRKNALYILGSSQRMKQAELLEYKYIDKVVSRENLLRDTLQYLQPFTSQQHTGAVKLMKKIVATSIGTNGSYATSVETQCFYDRYEQLRKTATSK